MFRIAVITLSDRAFRGEYSDLSGPALVELLKSTFPEATIDYRLLPDDADHLNQTFRSLSDCDYIFTTGGTGIGPRDITPDVTAAFCEKAIPGIAEWLRAESLRETPNAIFSRNFAGIKGKTIIVNFPGSKRGALFCLRLLLPVLEHGLKMISGQGH